MTRRFWPRTADFLPYARLCFALAIAVALTVLVGWSLGVSWLTSMLPGVATMKVNTALGLGGLAIAGILQARRSPPSPGKLVNWSSLFALAVTLLAVATLGEDISHRSFGIDEFFKADPRSYGTHWAPGRPSPVTAMSLALIGFALLLGQTRHEVGKKVGHIFAIIAWVLSFQALICYVEQVNLIYGSAIFTQVAVHTALAFVLICSGIFLSRPHEGIMAVITHPSKAGRIARWLLFFAILLPPSLSWCEIQGQNWGFWNEDLGQVLRVIFNVVFFSWIALQTGATLLSAELKERETLDRLRHAVSARGRIHVDRVARTSHSPDLHVFAAACVRTQNTDRKAA